MATVSYFNSRPHEEVDAILIHLRTGSRYFNSRPHEEVDNTDIYFLLYFNISTHDLTRRSTAMDEAAAAIFKFQLTTSRGGRLGTNWDTVWNAVFQLTTSRGGRRSVIYYNRIGRYISTHDLTRRSTVFNKLVLIFFFISTHDLTRRSTIHEWS